MNMMQVSLYYSRRAGLCAMTVLLLLFVFVFFQMGTLWHDSQGMLQVQNSDHRSQGESALTAFSILSSLHLFGQPHKKSFSLPGTHLELELTGVIEAVPASYSKAIIAETHGPVHIVGIGDVLPGSGARVQAIHSNSVVLDNGGHLEKLLLRRLPLLFADRPVL